MAALIAAPPMDSGSVGAGGTEESAAAAFKAAAGLSKHRAAKIPTANLKLLKSIVAFFKHGAKRLAPLRPVLEDSACQPPLLARERRCFHRPDREKLLVDRSLIDVPAFVLRRVLPGQITHGRETPLCIDRGRADYEFPLERVDRDARIGHRPVTISQPIDVRTPELATLVVGVDVGLEPHFRIQVHDRLLVQRAGIVEVAPWSRLDDVHMAGLPVLRAGRSAAVGGASYLWRMGRVHRGEQLLFAQKFIIVLLGLRVEARVMIRVEGLSAGRGAQDRLIQAAYAAAAGIPVPAVIATLRIRVAEADNSCSARILGREHRVKREQPEPVGLFEVWIDRQRLHLGAANQVVTRIVTDFYVVDYLLLLAGANILALTVKIAEVVIVALDRPEHVVPDDLLRNGRIVRVDQRERLACDITDHAAMVRRQADLR